MSFENSLKVGALGEAVAWDYLNKNARIRQVVDVRQDKRFQDADVDFLVERTDRQIFKVEVKTDTAMNTTGNVVYETRTSGNKGCLAKTQADVILYYSAGSGHLYSMRTDALRAFVKGIPYDPQKMGDAAEGYLLRLDELLAAGVAAQVDERWTR